MAVYANEKQVYGDQLANMPEEPPLLHRLEEIRNTLARALGTFTELREGPRPEPDRSPTPAVGVLTLGAECEKLVHAVESEAMVIVKRIGRL